MQKEILEAVLKWAKDNREAAINDIKKFEDNNYMQGFLEGSINAYSEVITKIYEDFPKLQ